MLHRDGWVEEPGRLQPVEEGDDLDRLQVRVDIESRRTSLLSGPNRVRILVADEFVPFREAASAKRDGQQNVGIITNAPGGIGDTIINAFKEDLPPNVTVVATAFDNADPAKTADVAAQMLTANPEINIIFSWEGTAVAGIITAIKEKDKVGEVFGVVNDLTPQVVDGIKEGTIYGTSQQHFCEMAKQSVDKLIAVSQGEEVPAATDTGTTFVTKDNLDAVLAEAAEAQ